MVRRMSSPVVQQAYSSTAPVYIDLFGSVESVHADDLAIIERHLTHHDGPVVDVGCGPGHLTGYLHAEGCEVRGIDPVPEFIDHARRTHPEASFERGSVADLPLAGASVPASLAGVLAWYSLIHLTPDELDDALAAIRRGLRTGGALVVGFFTGVACEPFEHKVATAYRWPVDELAARLAAVGLVEVERRQRAQDGDRRPHAVIVARAV